MSLYVIDVEADNKTPCNGSMVCFGAVMVADMSKTFYGQTAPIKETFNPEALAISGFSRQEHEGFDDPKTTMVKFKQWIESTNRNGRPIFISDNLAFDWMFIAYYFDYAGINNPFGYSGRRIGDLYCGIKMDAGLNAEWKRKYRKTVHSHMPVQDSLGNAEALLAFRNELGLKIKF